MITVTRNGKPLDKSLYSWDEDTRTFSSKEDRLTISTELNGCTFKTGYNCTLITGSYCTFNAGFNCTFNTGHDCTFDVGDNCVVIRRDVFEVIKLEGGVKIKLNECGVKGYEVINKDKK